MKWHKREKKAQTLNDCEMRREKKPANRLADWLACQKIRAYFSLSLLIINERRKNNYKIRLNDQTTMKSTIKRSIFSSQNPSLTINYFIDN